MLVFGASLTSALKVLSSSVARTPRAHSQSTRSVRLQSNQRQLSRELGAIAEALLVVVD